jgi:hypothetical protein
MRAPPEENPPGATGGLGILFHDRNDLLNKATIASAQAIVLGFDIGTGGAGALVIFLDAAKESPLVELAQDGALAASLAPQSGCPLNTLRQAVSWQSAGPLGAALGLIEGTGE